MARQTIAKRTIAERIAERLDLGQTQTLQVIQSFLDEVIQDILDSWSGDSFLDRETAEREFRTIATWLREAREPLEGPGVLSDRLLYRRLADLLLQGVIAHWKRQECGDPRAYMEALSGLQSIPRGCLSEYGDAFASRLADPDGFELVVEMGHDLRSPPPSTDYEATSGAVASSNGRSLSGDANDRARHSCSRSCRPTQQSMRCGRKPGLSVTAGGRVSLTPSPSSQGDCTGTSVQAG